jgi:RNA polymerase sigma factor (sigma-70 family)
MPTDPFLTSILSASTLVDRQSAWSDFLDRYSSLIYHVVLTFHRDPDRSGNCYLFVCEHLSANDFRRLRKFNPSGPASFSTWLCAVTRNLCLDWHRKEHGRYRVFGSVAQRSAADQALFELVFRQGFSVAEAREELSRRRIGLSFAEVEERISELRRCVSSRQLWLLSSGKGVADSITSAEEGVYVPEPADPAPDPEALLVLRESHARVSSALASLTDSDRLLVRLRYHQGLTLQQVAKLLGLKDAQTADRRLRDIIEHLRQVLGVKQFVPGKVKPASV